MSGDRFDIQVWHRDQWEASVVLSHDKILAWTAPTLVELLIEVGIDLSEQFDPA